jgi:hypothetical protein
MTLLISFLICWTPYSIGYLWPLITDSHAAPFVLSVLGPLIAKAHTVVTPMIFLYTQDDIVKID